MEALKQAETYVSAKLTVIKTIFSIFQLEARLAGLSIYPLLLSLCMVFIALITVWLLSTLLIGYGILLVSANVPITMLVVLLLNLGLLFGLLKYLAYNLKSMSFEKTRMYFAQNKSTDYDPIEETDKSSNRHDGQDITTPPNQGDGA